MKKVLCIILVLAMALSLSGCHDPVKDTKLFKTFDLIKADTFSYEVTVNVGPEELEAFGLDANDGTASLKMYRDKNNFYAEFLGQEVAFVNNRRLYDLDYGARIAYYTEMSEQVYKSFLDGWQDRGAGDAFVNTDGAKFLTSGRTAFQGAERYYEEFRDKKGIVSRAFFDGDDLVGILTEQAGGGWVEIPFKISASVPEGRFDLPEGFQQVRKQ